MQNNPLWLWQRDLLTPYSDEEREYPDWQTAYKFEDEAIECFVHRDNLFFNEPLIKEFMTVAQAVNGRCVGVSGR
ncbi:MAG: hypothetical protein M5U34_28270 [Chloroflexi bacterium]|nr:hypothetical protein [Chloroflexota bacterium]